MYIEGKGIFMILKYDSWEKLKRIIIFGYGRQARRIISKLDEDFDIVSVVDNSDSVVGTEWKNGKYVEKFDVIKSLVADAKIIVCLMGKNYENVSEQLRREGYIERENFIKCEEFISEWYIQFKNELCIMSMDVLTTTFCNLRCKGCAAFVPYINNAKHISCSSIVESLDTFFDLCDYCFSLMLYGGEPLLNPELPQILDVIVERYKNKIGYIGIITNGCCILEGDILDSIIRNKVGISISDYSDVSGYGEKVENFCKVLEHNNIDFDRNTNMEWRYLGFPEEHICLEPIEGQTHKKSCGQVCHAVVNGKIYYCATAAVAEESRLFPECSKDFYHLRNLGNMPNAKNVLKEFICGEDLNYKGFCDVCGGFGMDNPNIIKAGRQR